MTAEQVLEQARTQGIISDWAEPHPGEYQVWLLDGRRRTFYLNDGVAQWWSGHMPVGWNSLVESAGGET